jgi:hypothetical protein
MKKACALVSQLLLLMAVLLVACTIQNTQAPTPAPNITLQDNGKTITLHVGQTVLLKLGEDYQWDIQIIDQSVISRIKNITVIRGAQGVYEVLKVGNTTLSAKGDPVCLSSTPPCLLPSIQFLINIVVTP